MSAGRVGRTGHTLAAAGHGVDYLRGKRGAARRRYGGPVPATRDPVPLGTLLREWRQRRRVSQLELALDARVSARHLSFLETGRSRPSRQMVLHLAEQLEVPLRE